MPDPDAAKERRLRVLVVDDHDVVQWGFRMLLGQCAWVERTLAARTCADALALATRYEPHVALVDLFIGDESGAEASEQLRTLAVPPRVLLISGSGRISPTAARAAGAAGFILKDRPAAEVADAVRRVGLGATAFASQDPPPALELTPRERDVLELIATGATNREIAASLFLSPHTIKEHTSVLYRKLTVRNRAQAVRRAQLLGLLA